MTYRIDIPQTELDDLRDRLDRVRFPRVQDETDTTGGISVAFVRQLVEHWRDRFDWRAKEAELNELDHRVTRVGEVDLHHVVHEAAPATGLPIVLLHGWPDSFHRYHHLAPLLAAAGHDVIVPSLPGFPLSSDPAGPLTTDGVAELIHELMTGLGHERYVAHGGDWGSAVSEALATAHPEAVAALHLIDVPYYHQFMVDRDTVSDVEKAFLDAGAAWAENASYFTVQSAEPTTISVALSDSPVGLAAWIGARFVDWSDDVDLDELLTHVMLYWHGNAIRSSFRLYNESSGGDWDSEDWGGGDDAGSAEGWAGGDDASSTDAEAGSEWGGAGDWAATGPLAVPTALALFPNDIVVPPREYAERFFDVRRFTLMPAGGHFGAADEPHALAADIVAFLASLDEQAG